MAHLHSNFMTLFNGKRWIYGHIHFSMESVAYPSDPDLGNILHTGRMVHGVSDFINHLWINTVKEAGKYSLARFPHNAKYGYGYYETNNGVCERIAQPNPDSAEEYCETGQPVNAGMLPVCNQRCAADLFAYFDAENCNGFIAEKADYGCNNNRPDIPLSADARGGQSTDNLPQQR